MKRKLLSIAKQLSSSDLQEIIRFMKTGDKKTVALKKRREKLLAELKKIDAALTGSPAETAGTATPARRRANRKGKGRPGRKPAAKAKKAGKKPAAKAAKRGGKRKDMARGNLSAAVRAIFARAGTPLKARNVVEGLSEAGMPVKDVADMRKRVSVILASQKNCFEQVERGVYRLKE